MKCRRAASRFQRDDHRVPKGETVNKFEEVLTSSSPFLSSPTRFNPNRQLRGEVSERGPHCRPHRTAQPRNRSQLGRLMEDGVSFS